jgi:rSAM/selenodomain-associated transferase 2
LDEEETLPHLLADLTALDMPVEVMVADGGSHDQTLEVARRRGARVIQGERGRGRQMNAGARAIDTPWILFLHADSRLPLQTAEALSRWLDSPPTCQAGHFSFRLDQDGLWWSVIERGQRIREKLTGLAYGDQGLVLSRAVFEEVNGIPEIPLMEDVEIVRRLRRNGGLDRIAAPLITSARRYQREGPVRSWVRNVVLLFLYSVGVSPGALSRWYRPHGRL